MFVSETSPINGMQANWNCNAKECVIVQKLLQRNTDLLCFINFISDVYPKIPGELRVNTDEMIVYIQ